MIMTGALGWRPQFRSSESLFFSASQLANLDFMSDSMPRNEVRTILENAWSVVGPEFDEEFILGPVGAQFVKTHAIKTSNDTFNVVMTLVCAMASLTNGATIAMFACQDPPQDS